MSMGEDMLRDIAMYAQSTVEDCQNIAKEVQEKMKTDIAPVTPVGKGDRGGHLRDGWTAATIRLRNSSAVTVGSSTVNLDSKLYAVRNRKKPQLVHLVNFPHRIVVHGQDTGRKTAGNPFVDRISEEGQRELDRRLTEYFERNN